MPPSAPAQHVLNGGLRNSKARGQREMGAFAISVRATNLKHLRLSQLCVAGPLTVRDGLWVPLVMMPLPASHIAHVVGMRSELKVCRLATRRVVALVANIHATRDRSIRKFVSDPVCGSVPAEEGIADLSVTVPIPTAGPFQTTIRALSQFSLEVHGKIPFAIGSSSIRSASASTPRLAADFRKEFIATVRAWFGDFATLSWHRRIILSGCRALGSYLLRGGISPAILSHMAA